MKDCDGLKYLESLEDEVMELRATVQVLRAAHETNMDSIELLNAKLEAITNERDGVIVAFNRHDTTILQLMENLAEEKKKRVDSEEYCRKIYAHLEVANKERDMWKKRADELAIEKVFGHVV